MRLGVERILGQHGVYAIHDVLIVGAAQVVFVGCGKLYSVIRRTARIGPQQRPALPNEERGQRVVAVFKGAHWATMDIDDERKLGAIRAGREIEQSLDGEAAAFPLNQFRLHPAQVRRSQFRCGHKLTGIAQLRRVTKLRFLAAAPIEPHPTCLLQVGIQTLDKMRT
jgi:hypothetical protein